MQAAVKYWYVLTSVVVTLAATGCSFIGDNRAPVIDRSATTVYTVQPGDTLYSISRRYGVDPMNVARDNQLENPSMLNVGQRLRINVARGSIPDIPTTHTYGQVGAIQPAPAPAPAPAPVASPEVAAAAAVPPAPPTRNLDEPIAGNPNSPFVWPAKGKIVKGYGGENKGLDIGGREGDPVVAAADGQVIFEGTMRGYGNLVIVKHNPTYVTAYGHNKNILVKQGATVKKGQQIAVMGKTESGEPKVHFEVRKLGKPIDPAEMLPNR
ncbi:MAG: peptidoglycan DD-metalloendopeptidase family protein [Burkholderiales bacterium]|nr:peptidoglycan DD-metalloendopeptidase family protein [Burkholderiales bacterium]